jgi:two-component system sensor histidine kinase UhpB
MLITLLFALILLAASFYVINNARTSVKEEMQSVSKLTLQLIEIALMSNTANSTPEIQQSVLENIANLESTRHLEIELYKTGNIGSTVPVRIISTINAQAPEWFIRMVKPQPVEYRRVFRESLTAYTEILIRANPSDEITEVWNETKGVLGLLVLFAVLANILVYISLGRGLAPIESILKGLDGIERGEYQRRLPRFKFPEFSRISEKFNNMAEVLQSSRDENRLLTQKSLAIQEDERRILAQELHDEFGQSITAIKAVLASIEQTKHQDSEALKNSARIIGTFSDRMYEVARRMMRQLRPAILDEFGLISALQDMIDDWNSRHEDVFCYFEFNGKFDELGEEVNISIYRVIQESLTNIIKHAQATDVTVCLQRVKNDPAYTFGVKLLIKDNGIGFDETNHRGLGLLGMRERVEALKGSFAMKSATNEGVEILVSL